ncbi:hypothetical protein TUM17565_00480 [Klebsiella pneumoniae]|nr:hypothetical protein TUM17565_00480 [Klebsiella pneumoniae]
MNGSVRQSPAMGILRRSRFNARWRLRLTGNGHSAPFPLQCPVAAAPYRAYTLPARSCRPGKRSAARHQV